MRRRSVVFFLYFVFSYAVFFPPHVFPLTEDECNVASPNGRLVLEIEAGKEPKYSVRYDGRKIVLPSRLGLEFQNEKPYGEMKIAEKETRSDKKAWEYPWGRQRHYVDHFNELVLELKETKAPYRSLGIVCRAYDDGVAFRYKIDEKNVAVEKPFENGLVVRRELTEYNIPGDPTAWYADLGSFHGGQESFYPESNLGNIVNGAHVGCPIVLRTDQAGPYVALCEAELNHWGGLYFEAQEDTGASILFESKTLRGGEEAQNFQVPLKNVQRVILHCGDANDGIGHDHADWANLVLTDVSGREISMSQMKPVAVSQGFGRLQSNKSVNGNPLRIGKQEYPRGFGTHANSHLVFELDGKYLSLRGFVGVDGEAGDKGSVRFSIRSIDRAGKTGLQARPSPRRDGKGIALLSEPGFSPWRVLIVAPKAIDLVDQSILMNLSEPTDPKSDWSWIAPGIGTWDWWSDSNVNMSTEGTKAFIDFASEMGWQYHFLDDPWYAGKKYGMGDPRNNILTSNDDLDMEAILKHAKEKNVKLFLWLNWKDFDRQMDEALETYEKWGIAGLKIDFMDRDDQEMVEWYDQVVQKAAGHQLMINFHGAFKPTGYRRAWPNLITREGIYGNEQNKGTRMPPEHYCTLPFTRLMLGPGDFTPGAFLNRHYDGPDIRGAKTARGTGTRAHELAISMLYDSPILCMCDRPENYRGQKGLDFYRDLPTVWDESHAIEGEIGEYFSMIRRKGDLWYYAAITDGTPRTLRLPLDFLGNGEYEATIYADNAETPKDAGAIGVRKQTVQWGQILDVIMERDGGQAILFKKKK